MNPLDPRKGINLKKIRNPTFGEFEAQPSEKRSRSPHLSDQGWERCKSGFDKDMLNKELVSNLLCKVKKRSTPKSRLSTKGAVPQMISDVQIEGSEEEGGEEEPGDVAIDWSSSDSSVSDVEPLVCDASPESKQTQNKDRFIFAAATASRPKRNLQARHGLSKEQDFEIQDTDDEDSLKLTGISKIDANIDYFESPAEEQSHDTSASPSIGSEPSQQTCNSAQISELSPSPTEDLDRPGSSTQIFGTQITGTQWIQRLRLPPDSPDRGAGERKTVLGLHAAGNSAKKKSKFVKSGLAERLQKLMNREKSSIAFWNHQLADTKKQPQVTNSTLTVEVQCMELLQSLYITKCSRLARDLVSDADKPADNLNQQMFVLFAHNTGEHLKLAIGSKIRIHPPWQKLTLPNYSEPVILCTYFCQALVCVGDDDVKGDKDETSANTGTTLATSFSSLKKPFHPLRLFEGVSMPSTHTTATGSLLQSVTSSDLKVPVSNSILECVAESGAYSSSGMCVRARVQRVYCKRINSPTNQGIGPLGRHHPITDSSAEHSVQWTMLLQDRHGVFCELQLPIDSADRPRWKTHIQHGEGKVLRFSGVKVVQRTNRSRSPALFSLIDSNDNEIMQQFSSQSGSDTEENSHQGAKKTRIHQNFCYTLGFQLGQGTVEEETVEEEEEAERDTTETKQQVLYQPPHIYSLKTIIQEVVPTQRVSFYATVLHCSAEISTDLPGNTSPTHYPEWHILLSDPSLQSTTGYSNESKDVEECRLPFDGLGYSYLHVRSGCVLCGLDMAVIGQFGGQVFCKDVCVQQDGVLHADMYSAILKLDNNCQGCDRITGCHQPEDSNIIVNLSGVAMPTLPQLSDASTEHSLVAVNGKIKGADESTAYSWPVCPVCNNDRLQGGERGSLLVCTDCTMSITNPVIKMHLKVFLDCAASQNNNTVVKVKLLQSTIESILPPLSVQNGCDIQCIMGKTLDSIWCFVSSITVLPSGERRIELEEINI